MKLLKLVVFLLIAENSFSQIGGTTSFSSLNNAYSARATAFGGSFISIKDADVSLAIINPSLLNEQMHKQIGFTHQIQTGGVNSGMLCSAKNLVKTPGFASLSLRYVDYGKMKETLENGTVIGDFTPADFIVSTGYGRKIRERINIGVQASLLYSQYASYYSLGLGVDFAATYENKDNQTLFTLLVKNVGSQFKGFISNSKTMLPAEIQMAFSHKLAHAPIRFSYLAHHLNYWDISYQSQSNSGKIDPLTGDSIKIVNANTIQKIAHHFTPQVEFLLSKNLHIRLAFDYHRREEYKLINRPAMAGFSFGLGMYFKRFSLDYGIKIYSAAGYLNGITLTTNPANWKKAVN
jgi:hypothetical protein